MKEKSRCLFLLPFYLVTCCFQVSIFPSVQMLVVRTFFFPSSIFEKSFSLFPCFSISEKWFHKNSFFSLKMSFTKMKDGKIMIHLSKFNDERWTKKQPKSLFWSTCCNNFSKICIQNKFFMRKFFRQLHFQIMNLIPRENFVPTLLAWCWYTSFPSCQHCRHDVNTKRNFLVGWNIPKRPICFVHSWFIVPFLPM